MYSFRLYGVRKGDPILKLKQDISIGENMKKLRLKNKLSQEEVAALLQVRGLAVSREMISQMELGRYSVRISVLMALCEIYHVKVEEFFEGLLPDNN